MGTYTGIGGAHVSSSDYSTGRQTLPGGPLQLVPSRRSARYQNTHLLSMKLLHCVLFGSVGLAIAQEEEEFTVDADLEPPSTVLELNDDNAELIFGTDVFMHFIAFIKPDLKEHMDLVNSYNVLAEEFKGTVVFSWLNVEDADHAETLKELGVEKADVPKFLMLEILDDDSEIEEDSASGGVTKYTMPEESGDIEKVKQFVQDVLDKKIKGEAVEEPEHEEL